MATPQVLVVATANAKKLQELRRILTGLDVDMVSMAEVGLASPDEDGSTFEDNALIKARAAVVGSGHMAMADDSGLEVDALGGAPGVYSARWAGADADDGTNIARLLSELDGVPDDQRTARFVSAVALVLPDGREWVVRGTMEGRILQAPDGEGGFGYDPVFLTDGQAVSNGRLSARDKDRLSHRGEALARILPILAKVLG